MGRAAQDVPKLDRLERVSPVGAESAQTPRADVRKAGRPRSPARAARSATRSSRGLAATDAGIITLDVNPLDATLAPLVRARVHRVDHRHAACSTACSRSSRSTACSTSRRCSRRAPSSRRSTAHQVNVEGTLNLLEFAQKQGESHGRPVVFVYPSSIAAYGLPDLATKARAGRVREDEYRASDDDVRVQQAVLRGARALLRAPLQAAVGRRDAARRLPRRPVSRA